MARGGRTAEDDEAWRPTKEDAIAEYDDEILDEEMAEEEPKVENQPSSRASPRAQHKKTSHRPKRQDDEAWKPTDEDLDEEELEVQEMVNHQLMEESSPVEKPKKPTSSKTSKTSSPHKKPVGRPKHQDDDVWKPEGEDVENEDPEDEDSVEDEPKARRRTPPRQTKKRPAATSAGSPEQHKTTKPGLSSPGLPSSGLSSPKHRLTTSSNKKAPDFIVRGTNEKAPFTFTAYRGEGMVMLAMNWKQGTPPDDFVGFVIEYTEPQSSKCEYPHMIFFGLVCFQLSYLALAARAPYVSSSCRELLLIYAPCCCFENDGLTETVPRVANPKLLHVPRRGCSDRARCPFESSVADSTLSMDSFPIQR